jgi:hypothetical protein
MHIGSHFDELTLRKINIKLDLKIIHSQERFFFATLLPTDTSYV